MPNAAGPDGTFNPAVAQSADLSKTRHARIEEWLRSNNVGDYIVWSQFHQGPGKCDYCLFLLFFKS